MKGGQKLQIFLKNYLSLKNFWPNSDSGKDPIKDINKDQLKKQYSSYQRKQNQNRKTKSDNQTAILKNNIPITLLCIATGIGLYFNLPGEGNSKVCALLIVTLLFLGGLSQNYRYVNNLIIGALIIIIGYSLALYRTHTSTTPLLSQTLKSFDVVMMVEENQPLQKSRIRYTGKLLSLSKLSKNKIPKRVRIRTTDQGPRFKYGDLLCMRAMLARPKGPIRAGGYDFGFALWFKQIGATGFNISPLRLCPYNQDRIEHQSSISQLIANIRSFIGNKIDNGLNEPERAMARALILGDRGRVNRDDLEAMRKAGLGHLLAISGLHMAVFGGTLFILIRALLALFPIFSQNHPIKKYAALSALIGSFVYFLISGQSIPTQRAVLMISVLFTAIMIERTALTLRNVAVAALIILFLKPESLMSAGFQMSFAAVTALIVTYQMLRDFEPLKNLKHTPSSSWLKPFYYLGGIWITSIIATIATAPFAIYHFQNVSYMGPVGNMLAIPVFSLLLMPSALISLILMPFGLEALAFIPLKYSIQILLSTAHWTASFYPATITFGAISLSTVLIMMAGLVLVFFTNRPVNLIGAMLIIIAPISTLKQEKPDIYIGATAELIALRGEDQKLYAPTGRKGTFVLKNWLKADGDTRTINYVRNSQYLLCDDSACTGKTSNLRVTLIKSIAALEEACQTADILIYRFSITRKCKNPKLILSKKELTNSGTLSIYIKDGKMEIISANQFRKNRIWSAYR